MKTWYVIFAFLFISLPSWAQTTHAIRKKNSIPITIKWVDHLSGNFSFKKNWSYPLAVEMKADGRAGCADGGFCPERCYSMMDSNMIVFPDSAQIFYQLLDTTHQFHSIQCQAQCYEWDGTDIIDVFRKSVDSVSCCTTTGVATHSSLQLEIIQNICVATIDLTSIVPGGNATFYCTDRYITIDKTLWKNDIMKAKFNLNFESTEYTQTAIYWRGKIYAKIKAF